MEHLNGPCVHCNVLTRDNKDEEGEQHGDFMNFFCDQQGFEVLSQVSQNYAHDQLSWNDPTLTLANALEVIEFDKRGPENFEAEGKGAHHDHANLAVGQELLKEHRHGHHEQAQRHALERVQHDQQRDLRQLAVELLRLLTV